MKFNHALVIGGTGMLFDGSVHLAASSSVLTAIGRNPDRLNRLQDQAEKSGSQLNALQLDYTEEDKCIAKLNSAIDAFGPIDCALLWIHSSAPNLPLEIAKLMNNSGIQSQLFHVMGSPTADPSRSESSLNAQIETLDNVSYYRVILGFVVENGRSRWLTDTEISAGVITALSERERNAIVGVVDPWDARP